MAATRALPAGFGELEVLAVGTVLLIEALSGLSLNGLTIFSFCKTPDLRTPNNLLVLSLALADSGISLNALVAAVSSLLRNIISFLFTMAFFNFVVPLFITLTSYRLMEHKFSRSGHLQVNTTLPGRMLLLGWGPYALLYLYAAIADVPALIAKTMPTINAINYALHSEMVYRGIWQCLSPQKSKQN
ncbi:hypothetical protein A6R68_07454 [Neotoma lepida]|uniref:G-protein coupled receptors family 1 profile domain-containing protein n=1 Tax=Neotoma lepida TaxID=56216 RepID=A0A1A6GCN9_NEOLE|nr:hypothetical protein A6R68_07454 [Neotoma lepida]